MAQRTFHESDHEGRSVLGMLEVQVERDPKTGATVVRSVAPVSSPAGAPNAAAAAVFDDGRKSIHAVGRSAGQPSSEELGQILHVIDGVGMRVLLDEVAVTPAEADVKAEEAADGKVSALASRHAASEEFNAPFDRFARGQAEAEEKCATTVVRDVAEQVDYIEERRLEEGPVTLMFLGYTDTTGGADDDAREDQGGVIPVERVIITEDGEELLVEPQTPAPDKKELQDVPLDANGGGTGGGGEEGDKAPQSSTPARKAEEEGKAKRKTCQCCSVM